MMADTAMTLFVYRCIQTKRRWLIDDDGWHSNDTLCLQMHTN
jgi:hypothetical protein